MWPFSSATSSTSTGTAVAVAGGSAPAHIDPSSMQVPQDAEGVASDVPVIAYTEQVIAEKEASLRKYIQDNYAKIHAVEKELEALRLEVKLTSGSKKAAHELLRRKIEESTERIRTAREREKQAKQAWEAALRTVEQEEEHKSRLCEDLRLMIQESALQQYERLESLTKKLDALNPEMKGIALSAIEGLRAQIAPHGAPVINGGPEASNGIPPMGSSSSATQSGADGQGSTTEGPDRKQGSGAPHPNAAAAGHGEDSAASNSSVPHADGRGGKQDRGRVQRKGQAGRGRGLVKGHRASGPMSLQSSEDQGGWTGAGFDVDERS